MPRLGEMESQKGHLRQIRSIVDELSSIRMALFMWHERRCEPKTTHSMEDEDG